MAFVLHHVGLSCNDPIAIERWYTKHFGFKRGRVYAPGEGQVVMIQAGGVYLELFSSTEERPGRTTPVSATSPSSSTTSTPS